MAIGDTNGDARNSKAVNDLIGRLVADGWRPTGKGGEWYQHRFQRRARQR